MVHCNHQTFQVFSSTTCHFLCYAAWGAKGRAERTDVVARGMCCPVCLRLAKMNISATQFGSFTALREFDRS